LSTIWERKGISVHRFSAASDRRSGQFDRKRDSSVAESDTRVQGYFACGGVAFLILLDIVDDPMNGSSYAQCATPQYLKTVQFSSVNLEP
jgi:hypothetical protein